MSKSASPAPASPDRRGRAAAWIIAIAAVYLIALCYVDRDRSILSRLSEMAVPLALCALAVLLSYLFRYQRWRSVLAAQGHPLEHWWPGLLAYLAGFAFTASPGKAGELLRIRYFGWLDVPGRITLTTFIFERAIDLLVITLLAIGASSLIPAFGLLALIILALLLALLALACWPPLAAATRTAANWVPTAWLRRLAHFLVDGGSSLRPLLRPRLLCSSTGWGAAAWLLTAFAFAWLCYASGISLTWPLALGIYPLAMLIGALSFVPGGVGTTEAAIVLMLAATGVATDMALAIAIGIRLVSLWLAVLVGMLAMAVLESTRTSSVARD
ncbi:lysylphosphatidylglycerol synthase transmembrane domain-containing protein [Stenotrophomonas indicatrix]|uniref:lysylphosphatidylglycerol synthase transmembrane domain-containing protein n=1 Tax=Stenotrophomonas indicatrix TaxID=2045451 RepID=UPI0007394E41|nr:lysylphosphatidylglycerol synthase transmembrane domain-containing protein [Stenotrophomonas indicatrix]CRD61440.1 putative transmembrane protein [Stenotrophomonas indicatrix]